MLALYKAALVTAFAPASQRAFRAACWRLGSLTLLALVVSYVLGRSVSAPSFSNFGDWLLFPSALFIAQIVVLCTLLASAGLTRRLYHDTFARWLAAMPVSQYHRWLALNLPNCILAALAAILVSWPLAALYLPLGLHPLLLLTAFAGGTISALGLICNLPTRSISSLFLLPILLWCEYKLLGIVHGYETAVAVKQSAMLAFVAIISTCIALFVCSSNYTLSTIVRLQSVKNVALSFLPNATWPAKKLFRSPSFRLSFAAAFVLNATAVFIGKQYGLDSTTITLFTSLTVAACIADIRGFAARYAPPEITALRGVIYFWLCELAIAGLVGTLLGIPLFWLGGSIITASLLLLTGLAAGLFAGTLLTPQSRDISSQFLATLLCLGIMAVLPALPLLPAGIAGKPPFLLTCTGLLVIASGYIEYHRNRFTWRTLTCLKRKDRRS